jgi:hypothetical protein
MVHELIGGYPPAVEAFAGVVREADDDCENDDLWSNPSGEKALLARIN